MNVILPCLRGNGKFWLKFEFVGDVGLEKRSENIRIQWNENRIPEKMEWESSSTFPGKAHPFVCIPLFSALIQQTLSPIISNADKKKRRQNFIDYSRLFIRFSFLKQEMNLFSNISTEHSSHISR